MIHPEYVRTMARYNSWQNSQLMPVLTAMSPEDLTRNRGAFFGGLLATANHLLWGDRIWMSRFDPSVEAPAIAGQDSPDLHPTVHAWGADRLRMDGAIQLWAERLRALDLKRQLTFYSGSAERDITASVDASIVHFFNHQTHHRGQIHAMLTAAGQTAPVSDLLFMPEDA